jgi:hypothetical protein
MRILIDECIDARFRNSSADHDCQTARYAGMAGLKNGELLSAAEAAKFDVLLTVDQGIECQQNLVDRKISIIIFCPRSNRLTDSLSIVSVCRGHIQSLQPGQIIKMEIELRLRHASLFNSDLIWPLDVGYPRSMGLCKRIFFFN